MAQPTKWIDPDEVERLSALGLTQKQIAASLGICWDTFANRRRDQIGIKEAYEKGRAIGIAQVSNALFVTALKGNVIAQKFYLTNRDRMNWADRVEQSISGLNSDVLQTKHTIEFIGKDINQPATSNSKLDMLDLKNQSNLFEPDPDDIMVTAHTLQARRDEKQKKSNLFDALNTFVDDLEQ